MVKWSEVVKKKDSIRFLVVHIRRVLVRCFSQMWEVTEVVSADGSADGTH